MQELYTLKERFLHHIQETTDVSALEGLRIRLLGKQGDLSQEMKKLGALDPEERKKRGAALNLLKEELVQALEKQHCLLKKEALALRLSSEKIDLSLPVRPSLKGFFHPLSETLFEIIDFFKAMGFSVAEGPHIEQDYYNFDALNIPQEHPARQEHDTFYMPPDSKGQKRVLRTHTSPVQIRTLLTHKPPLRIIAPGRVFRSDYDHTHTPNFHQVEGLMIGRTIHMGHLKYCLQEFCRYMFGIADLPIRFRPSYFPFTEPSAEVDIGCSYQRGEALVLGKGEDWLEILGCGMVHPAVLRKCDINPDEFQGFAFGMGVERIAMLKHGIHDLRAFYESDMRWLSHYGFSIVDSLIRGERT